VFKFKTIGTFSGAEGVVLNKISEAIISPDYIESIKLQLQRKRKIVNQPVIILSIQGRQD
jgi:hypothetical protein